MKYFTKEAVRLHRVGKTRAHVVFGPGTDDFLFDRLMKQKGVKRSLNYLKNNPLAYKAAKEQLRQAFYENLGGTISKGKAYFSPGGLKNSKQDYMTARNILSHELFHLKPIIGKSETLAHITGGLHARKGKLSLSDAAKSYGHLWKTRPNVALKEHAIGAGLTVGGTQAVSKITAKKKNRK